METSINWLQTFTGVPLPYPKYDHIYVPEYRGAMENAGCITFAETYLHVGVNE